MKKISIYALMGAIALTGTMSFSACSSSDEVVNNPDFDPSTNTVKTQFAISLPSNIHAPKTRMSSDIVQETDNSFRGMQDIILLPFNTTTIASSTKLLSDGIQLEAIEGVKNLSGTGGYKVYNDVTIPMGTSAFVFYAQAKASSGTEFINGKTVRTAPTGDNAGTAGYTFAPQQIFSGDPTSTTDNTKGTDIATYLTSIASVTGWAGNANLGGLYTEFVKMTAGSSAAVLRAVTDLWKSLKNNSDDLSKAIVSAITAKATVSGDVLSLDNSIAGYPANLYLPDGAAAVKWNETSKEFEVDNSGNTVGSLNAYVYPASLWYTVQTPIKVASSKKADNNGVYHTTAEGNPAVTTWAEALALYDAEGSVSSGTRSIALVNPIQYAVGRLDVTVKCGDGTLYDQHGDAVSVPADGFPVSAVLIGGQKAVNFAFTAPDGSEYTIYDNEVAGVSAKNGTAEGKNYTLALETAANIDVNIAVELTNTTGKDFYGHSGQVIPAGGHFYLKATLGASSATETDKQVFKQDYYTIANLTILTGSATPGEETGLGTATNTIPDLRTPQLELGMSVDLHWQPGHQYDINL